MFRVFRGWFFLRVPRCEFVVPVVNVLTGTTNSHEGTRTKHNHEKHETHQKTRKTHRLKIRFKTFVIWSTLPPVKLIYKSHLANNLLGF
jgi:hypothetical protein